MRYKLRALIPVATAAVAASFLACGPGAPPTGIAEPSGSASTSAPPAGEATAPAPRPVSLGRLPATGVVVSNDRGTVLLDLDGTVLERLPNFHLAGNPGAPGVWLQRGRNYFRLDDGRRKLMAVARKVARARMYDEGREPDLPVPDDARIGRRVVGRWRYAYRSGDRALAQWSGECEVPTAFWVDGRTLQIISGEQSLGDAPESIALGWSPEGDALAMLGEGACGKSADRPGVYRFSAPGEGALIHETTGYASAEMW